MWATVCPSLLSQSPSSPFRPLNSLLFPPYPGEPDAQRLASDFCICRRPGCDTRGSQQRCPDPDGEGGPGLPQTGERKPNGRMEILHLLRFPSVPHVEKEGEEEEQVQVKGVETKEEEPVEDGRCNEDKGKAGRRRKEAWEREKDTNKLVEKQGKKKKKEQM